MKKKKKKKLNKFLIHLNYFVWGENLEIPQWRVPSSPSGTSLSNLPFRHRRCRHRG